MALPGEELWQLQRRRVRLADGGFAEEVGRTEGLHLGVIGKEQL